MGTPVGLKVKAFPYKNGLDHGNVCIKAEQPEYQVGMKKNGKPGTIPWQDPTKWVCTLQKADNPRATYVVILSYPEDFEVRRFKLKPQPATKPRFTIKAPVATKPKFKLKRT